MDNLFEAINQGRLDLVKTFLTDDPNLINKVASVDEKEFTPIELHVRHMRIASLN